MRGSGRLKLQANGSDGLQTKRNIVAGGVHGRGGFRKGSDASSGANLRNVWSIATSPFSAAHFATFPPALVEPCIKAGTSERGVCGDCGAPWVRVASETEAYREHKKRYSTWSDTHRLEQGIPNEVARQPLGRCAYVPPRTETTGWRATCDHHAAVIPATCLDPFGGAGTVGLVADQLQRDAILVEISPEYAGYGPRANRGRGPAAGRVRGGVMPIRPENRDRYPPEWAKVSKRIREERAGGRCECRGECGTEHLGEMLTDDWMRWPAREERCAAENWEPHAVTRSRRRLAPSRISTTLRRTSMTTTSGPCASAATWPMTATTTPRRGCCSRIAAAAR